MDFSDARARLLQYPTSPPSTTPWHRARGNRGRNVLDDSWMFLWLAVVCLTHLLPHSLPNHHCHHNENHVTSNTKTHTEFKPNIHTQVKQNPNEILTIFPDAAYILYRQAHTNYKHCSPGNQATLTHNSHNSRDIHTMFTHYSTNIHTAFTPYQRTRMLIFCAAAQTLFYSNDATSKTNSRDAQLSLGTLASQ